MGVPEGILCSKSHEYVVGQGDLYQIGLTEYAIEQLGDIVFVELPDVGAEFAKGEVLGTIESVKAASEIYMPVSGKVVEVNEALIDNPAILNESPYETGWLIKVESNTVADDSFDLLEYEDYQEEIG